MIKPLTITKCKYKITNNIVDEFINNKLLPLKSEESPLCIITVGVPASGKSTVSKIYIKDVIKKNIKNFCIINPDDILEKYFNNNIDCYDASDNSPYSVVNDLFNITVQNKYNIVYDTTGLNLKDIKPKIALLKKHKYKINIVVCLIDNISIALKRIKKRKILTGRNVDEDYFLRRYNELPKILHNFYFKLLYEKVDEIIIYNTSGKKPKLEEIYN